MSLLHTLLGLFCRPDLWQTAIEGAALLLLPALGGLICERSGVVNVALEGMMLAGCFAAIPVALASHSAWLGMVAGAGCGALLAVVHAVACVKFRADQVLSGVALNMLAAGGSTFLANRFYGIAGAGHVSGSEALSPLRLPLFGWMPVLRSVFEQNLVVYAALLCVPATGLLLYRTRAGVHLRACGENPESADTAGINVALVRTAAVVASGALSGFGGSFLALGIVGTFNPGMTAGRGFIALAALIFGGWRPGGVLVACLLFALGSAAAAQTSLLPVSPILLSMLPYVLTLAVLGLRGSRSIGPAAAGRPYPEPSRG